MKTLNNKILLFVPIFVIFGLIFSLFNLGTLKKNVYAEDSAKSMICVEQSSRRVLMSHNENEIRANASTTKIATFLTILKNCKDFDKPIKVDDRAVGIGGTSIYLKKGEVLTTREFLYGMMLVSGNDAATALALSISPSIEEFANLMTIEAKKAGAIHTTFKNPHGLDNSEHKTTAFDLAMIASECYNYPLFEKIVSTKSIKIPNINGYRYLKNKNKLLWSLDGCNGLKTGFTDDAGRCLVSSAKRDNMQVICVVLNCGPMFEESASHIENCFLNYKMHILLAPYSFIKKVPVVNSHNEEIKLFTRKGFSYPLTDDEFEKITYEILVDDNLIAPIFKEQNVGTYSIYLDNYLLFSEKIYTMESVESNRIGENIKRIISKW